MTFWKRIVETVKLRSSGYGLKIRAYLMLTACLLPQFAEEIQKALEGEKKAGGT